MTECTYYITLSSLVARKKAADAQGLSGVLQKSCGVPVTMYTAMSMIPHWRLKARGGGGGLHALTTSSESAIMTNGCQLQLTITCRSMTDVSYCTCIQAPTHLPILRRQIEAFCFHSDVSSQLQGQSLTHF